MESRIPKKIHYIWLSGDPYDKVTSKCIKSWKNVLRDYEIIKWDYEKCKDIINANDYAREAWSVKKYAFVSDYLRLYVLYHEGGIYMDADVEVVKPLDPFLNNKVFTCYEREDYLAVTLVGCEKGSVWAQKQLEHYDNIHFIRPDGSYDMTPNPDPVTRITKEFGAVINNAEEYIDSIGMHIYTKDYFSPIDYRDTSKNCFTDNTYAIHYFNAAWYPKWRRLLSKWKKKLKINPETILGEKLYRKIVSVIDK